MRSLVIIANDIRSTYNVGAIFRTADGFGVEHIYFTGITPYPQTLNDSRLPHLSQKLTKQIDKIALGAINTVSWSFNTDLTQLVSVLKKDGFKIIGLEQAKNSIKLHKFTPTKKTAILLGSEIDGIGAPLIALCDDVVEISMYGQKESFNVAQATAIALYALREA